ncbi:MAG: 30S ribosomal protein S20 [Christensenellales bacterium]|nr:30S ribosomal protein S20 [Clostridium sp.]MDY2926773.1 30S ribosomal protein S20 [Eubacteriales bacterium]MCI6817849.1 30S ribosomal protein S20 [Clostridium sp.]MCI6986874.1 30S ribosomal protein S20 [Clostridium sp.]MCI7012247.1 30S ribosomal protein S20 [Clostridium sp.]
MANIKSAMKRVKITRAQNLRNRMIISDLKTALKKFDKALESGDEAAISEMYTIAVSKVDKAVTKGVIHKNAANRKKAQLAKKLAAK